MLLQPTSKAVIPNTVVLELLNKYNYDDWVEMVQSYLISQDLWDSVDLDSPLDAPEEFDADHNQVAETLMDLKGNRLKASEDGKWKKDKKNAAALHAIQISCGPDALSAIRGIVSARQAWITLARKFRADFILKLPGFTLDLFHLKGYQPLTTLVGWLPVGYRLVTTGFSYFIIGKRPPPAQ
ncbi:hypothetical protein TIFTF001_035622 [Ficus carica]|uniref:DUF4219 domain-containing protein n=1 Tax=Ficus carica TaxID=3494 RepID=A0AA88J9V2_FICCA|nr:hypothetical protein TIFTF001_035622 [Ficus carica]